MSTAELQMSSGSGVAGRSRPRAAALAALAGLSVLLAGCSSAVVTEPAAHAADPRCAAAMLRTPDAVDTLSRRATTAQGTTAYGSPSRISVTCGVEPPAPTSAKCLAVNGVDWIVEEKKDPAAEVPHTWTATTYGTEPALQVVLNADEVPTSSVLPALGDAAKALDKKRRCL